MNTDEHRVYPCFSVVPRAAVLSFRAIRHAPRVCPPRGLLRRRGDCLSRRSALRRARVARRRRMKEYGVPGVALGVIDGGVETIRGLGVTNVEDPLPVTAHTV